MVCINVLFRVPVCCVCVHVNVVFEQNCVIHLNTYLT